MNKKNKKSNNICSRPWYKILPATKAQPKEMLPIVDKPTIHYIIEEAKSV